MAPVAKVSYFPINALGEPVKFILAYNNIEFEDVRVTYEEWPKVKTSKPFGKMPTLEIDGKHLHQSIALSRYYGKKAGLGGKDDWEDLQIDMAVDAVSDFRAELGNWHYEKNEESKTAKHSRISNETIPIYTERIDKLIAANKGYLANGKLSWGDIYFIATLDYLNHMSKTKLHEKSAHIKKLREKVINIPQIKGYLQKREPYEW